MARSFRTKNDLPEPARKELIILLNRNLADGIHLALQAKLAHWNVKGPHFQQLHQLFDEVHAAASGWVDLLAERAVQLGGVAEGTLQIVSERTRLPAYSLDVADGRDHVDALSQSLGAFGKAVRAAIKAADQAGDLTTADLFTQISRENDKSLWFVEAHLQAER